jgi:uncharacterized membrane protein (DUF2068 family)
MRLIPRLVSPAPAGFADRPGDTGKTEPSEDGPRRWAFLRLSYMRLLACVWLAQGLMQWAAMLVPSESVLDRASAQWTAAIVFFAVLDPIAAVGLWLATPWGGVIWLCAAAAQIITPLVIPGFFSPTWIGVNGLLVGVYILSTWLVTRSGRAQRARRS